MTRRTFFRRTLGALATAAIAPRLLLPTIRRITNWREPIIGVALTSARRGGIVRIRCVEPRGLYDYRVGRTVEVVVGDYVTTA